MPRSKRAKVVHLSKVEKKGRNHKEKVFAEVQECALKYPYIYVYSVENMRNTSFKNVRTDLSDSKIFFGKTRLLAKALGASSPTSSPQPNTDLLAPYLTGSVGLIFSPRDPTSIEPYFENFRPLEYARAGTHATRSFTIPQGTVYSRAGEIPIEDDVPVGHSQEPNLRKLGVPTRLVKGKVELDREGGYEVCKEGDELHSDQTTLLKMFGIATAEFRIRIRAYWEKVGGGEDGRVVGLEELGTTNGAGEGDAGEMEVDGDEEGWDGLGE